MLKCYPRTTDGKKWEQRLEQSGKYRVEGKKIQELSK